MESSLASEDEKAILAELDKLDLDENSALEVFVSLEKEKRTWKENKKLKLAQRKDRRHFSDKSSRPYPYKSQHKGKRGFNVDAIKKGSRCSNCGECQKPYRSKAERLEQERQSGSERSRRLSCSWEPTLQGPPALRTLGGLPTFAVQVAEVNYEMDIDLELQYERRCKSN